MEIKLALGSRIRKSPFFESAVAAGMTHATVYNHMYMPVSYGDSQAEYQRLTQGVAMWDVGVERQVQLAGPDALALAAYMTPRDLSRCRVGQGKYVVLCDHQGRIINDPVFLKLSDDLVWFSIADSDMLYWARALAEAKGFDVAVSEPDVSPLAVQGPLADEVMSQLFGDWVRSLRFFWFREVELDGIPLVVARSGWSKQGGFELYLRDGSQGSRLWQRVAEAGKAYGIGPGAPSTTERLESGLLSYATDTDAESDPFECNLDHLLDLDRPQDFVGKQALLQKRKAGIRRRLVGLEIDGSPMGTIENPYPILAGNRLVGTARATDYSPRLQCNIAIAIVEKPFCEAGTQVILDCQGQHRPALVRPLPFIK